jgi:hypothetical protein
MRIPNGPKYLDRTIARRIIPVLGGKVFSQPPLQRAGMPGGYQLVSGTHTKVQITWRQFLKPNAECFRSFLRRHNLYHDKTMLIRFLMTGLLVASAASAQAPATKDHTLGYDNTPLIPGSKWRVHDVTRPRPRIVTPGTESSQAKPGKAPSDAIVLFDGSDLSPWVTMVKGQPSAPKWKVQDGYMEIVDGTGSIETKEKFGDIQLHVEWASPAVISGKSQDRGNSGILLMGRYEVQVLDCSDNPTYADGQAAAIYGQNPPLVNACRKPGEWQTYDIAFEAPHFEAGKLVKPAFVTVFHNGVLVQNHEQILGTTPHAQNGTYTEHPAELPLQLQNHHESVRYRNIWIRRIAREN